MNMNMNWLYNLPDHWFFPVAQLLSGIIAFAIVWIPLGILAYCGVI